VIHITLEDPLKVDLAAYIGSTLGKAVAAYSNGAGLRRGKYMLLLKAHEAAKGAVPPNLPGPPSLPDDLKPMGLLRFSAADTIEVFYKKLLSERAKKKTDADALALDPPVAIDRSANALDPKKDLLIPELKDVTDEADRYTYAKDGKWASAKYKDWTKLHAYEWGFQRYMYHSAEENNAYAIERFFEVALRAKYNLGAVGAPWERRRLKFLDV